MCVCVCVLLSFQSDGTPLCMLHAYHARNIPPFENQEWEQTSRVRYMYMLLGSWRGLSICFFYLCLFVHHPTLFPIYYCVLYSFLCPVIFFTNPVEPRHEFVRLSPFASFMQPRWTTVCVQVQTNFQLSLFLSHSLFLFSPYPTSYHDGLWVYSHHGKQLHTSPRLLCVTYHGKPKKIHFAFDAHCVLSHLPTVCISHHIGSVWVSGCPPWHE